MIYPALFFFVLIAHIFAFGALVDPGTNVVIFCSNLIFVFCAVPVYKKEDFSRFILYLFGYLLIFVFVFAINRAALQFALFIILYSAFFRNRFLLPYFSIAAISIVFATPYWFQLFLLFSLYYMISRSIYAGTRSVFLLAMFGIGFIFLFLVIFPILYFSFQVTPQTLIQAAKNTDFQKALLSSIITSSISTLIILILGTPFAYVMARLNFKGKALLDNLIDLPILIPQTVAGIALLVLLGPKSPVGEFMFKNCRIAVTNGYLGIIAAQVFVSSPFFIRSAINAFEKVDYRLEETSRTLGASQLSTFARISVPLAGSGIFNGCILSWARALSEVGSIMVIAYYPMTAPVFIYDEFIKYGLSETQPMAIILVISCLWAFIALRWFKYQLSRRA